MPLSASISTYRTMSAVYSPGRPVQSVKLEALERWEREALALEQDNATLRRLLAAAERLVTAHHAAGMRRKGEVCPYCQREHETVNAIWRSLHQP